MGKSLLEIEPAGDAEGACANEDNERGKCHAAKEGPLKESPSIHFGVEHD